MAGRLGGINEWDLAVGEAPESLMDAAQVHEWLAAGHFDVSANPPLVTTMDYSSKQLISHIFFGFDRVLAEGSAQAGSKNFCLRLDPPMLVRPIKTGDRKVGQDNLPARGGSASGTGQQERDCYRMVRHARPNDLQVGQVSLV